MNETKFKIGDVVVGSHIENFPSNNIQDQLTLSPRKRFEIQGIQNIPWQTGDDGYYFLDMKENKYPAKLCGRISEGLNFEATTLKGDAQLEVIFG